MAIGTPVAIDIDRGQASSTSLSNTVPAGGVPAGADIVSLWAGGEAASNVAVADSATNAYTEDVGDDNLGPANMEFHFQRASGVDALAQNDTIDWTWDGSHPGKTCASFYVTGLDGNGPTNTPSVVDGSGTSPSSGSVATPAGDWIAIGIFAWKRFGGTPESTEDTAGGWAEIIANGGDPDNNIRLSHQAGTGVGSVTYEPTVDEAGADWFITVVVYSAAAAAGGVVLFRRRIEGY